MSNKDQGRAQLQWDLLKDALARNIEVHVKSVNGPCTFRFANQNLGDFYDGGTAYMVESYNSSTE